MGNFCQDLTRSLDFTLYLHCMSNAEVNPKTQQAIDAALSKDWQKALDLNKDLIKEYPNDVETLNRLARTYLELGEIAKAKTNYKKVLRIDSYNNIAEKNLSKLSNLRKNTVKKSSNNETTTEVEPDIFLEEPGKSKVLVLNDLARPSILAGLKTGDSVRLDPQKDDVIVFSQESKIVGKIEPSLSVDLGLAIRAGSKFTSLVKSVRVKDSPSQYSLSIFVKETYKSPKISKNIFPSTSSHFTPYVREETLNVLSDEQASRNNTPEEDETSEETEHKIDTEDLQKPSSLESLAAKEIEDDRNFDDN